MKIRRLGQSFILGIETSCDETAAAVVDDAGAVRSSVVASQFDVHARYGGVVPELASREHLRAIVPVVRAALDQAETSLSGLDAVAVTAGPGLVGSLLVGATYAKALAFAVQLPLVAVNHVEGHIFSVLLDHPEVAFPAVALVVSGGHTHLFYVGAPGEYRLLGRTRDDAAGEAYDKVAKLLGFGYPGGPLIDQLAPYGRVGTVRFTPARMKGNELDFSFSGLKTAVLRWTEAQPGMAEEIARRSRWTDRSLPGWLEVTPKRTLDMLAAFQHTVVEELLTRVRRATDETGADSVVVAGGVAANAGLRQRAVELFHGHCYFPTRALSTDNAAMIAAAAWPKLRRGDLATYTLKVQANLAIA